MMHTGAQSSEHQRKGADQSFSFDEVDFPSSQENRSLRYGVYQEPQDYLQRTSFTPLPPLVSLIQIPREEKSEFDLNFIEAEPIKRMLDEVASNGGGYVLTQKDLQTSFLNLTDEVSIRVQKMESPESTHYGVTLIATGPGSFSTSKHYEVETLSLGGVKVIAHPEVDSFATQPLTHAVSLPTNEVLRLDVIANAYERSPRPGLRVTIPSY